MKKWFVLAGSLVFFIGCAEKTKMATNVVDLAHNPTVIGWEGGGGNKQQFISSTSKYFSPVKKHFPLDSDMDGVPDYNDRCPNTPVGVAVNHYGCRLLTTLRFNFNYNSAKVRKEYYGKIQHLAAFLKRYPKVRIEIDGYTDNEGTEEYNYLLSKKRAQAVRDILVNKFHISPARIVVKGFGNNNPLVPNTTPQNKALNRRVEVVAIGGNSKFLNTNLYLN